ncbi:PTS sugar transporter subunit IIA [Leuconostoc citreum]
MNYLILVSHGQFSEGLRDALSMFIGDDIEQVRAIGLKSGEDTTNFGSRFKSLLSDIALDGGLIVLGDIIGGSPLTTVTDILNQQQRLSETIVLGGMNFPMALNAAILKNTMSGDDLVSAVLHEATTAVKQFELIEADEDEDEI